VASTTSRLQKVRELAGCLRGVDPPEVPIAIAYLSGETCQGKIGVSYASLQKAREAPADIPTLTLSDLDHAFDPPSAFCGIEYGVRVHSLRANADTGILLGAGVDADLELALVLARQQADDPVVLELLPDRPNEDRAHLAPPKERTPQNDAILYQRRLRCFAVSPASTCHRYHCHFSDAIL